MARLGEPFRDDLLEFIASHAGMGGHDQLQHAALAEFRDGLHVAVEHRREGLLVLPFGVHRRELLNPVEPKGELDIHGLLAPQRSIVVEGRDPVRHGYEVRRALARHGRDEIQDRLLGRPVVPRRKRVGRSLRP